MNFHGTEILIMLNTILMITKIKVSMELLRRQGGCESQSTIQKITRKIRVYL